MSYNILGINLSHNSSVCVLVDGEIDFFLEEDRLSRFKHDHLPMYVLETISSKFKIDEIFLTGIKSFYTNTNYQKPLTFIFDKFFPNIKINSSFIENHHNHHSSISFYNSGFSKSLNVVIDGGGSTLELIPNNLTTSYHEAETLSVSEYPFIQTDIYKSHLSVGFKKVNKHKFYNPLTTLSKTYEAITSHLGFKWDEAGKTMGLSSYGKEDKSLPPMYINHRGNPKVVNSKEFKESCNLNKISPQFHKDQTQLTPYISNLAFKIQQDSQKEVGDLIEKGLKETNLKHVCCAGGYFLNCVANYYLIKRFPDVEFYFEPISSDAGNAIGIAKLAWHKKTQDTTIRPQKTLYYGPKYSKEDLLKGIQKYLD